MTLILSMSTEAYAKFKSFLSTIAVTKDNVSVTRDYLIDVGEDGITTISYPGWGIMQGTYKGNVGETPTNNQ